jgi:hypothetical protein
VMKVPGSSERIEKEADAGDAVLDLMGGKEDEHARQSIAASFMMVV